MVCDVCKESLLDTREKDVGVRRHHESPSSLIRSVQAECHFCLSLWRNFPKEQKSHAEYTALEHAMQTWPNENPKSGFTRLETWYARNGSLLVQLSMLSGDWPPATLAKYRARNGSLQHYWFATWHLFQADHTPSRRSLLAVSTKSVSSLETARNWIATCICEHAACKRQIDPTWYPTRLLDLNGLVEDGTGLVKIVNPASSPIAGPYNSLSHCWGSEKFLILSAATADELYAGIPITNLNQTFQDAILVSKALRVHYIWIDSLCILQGDRDEWLRESIRMGEVYANARCNIAATASSRASDGLFRDRNAVVAEDFSIEAKVDEATGRQWYSARDHDYWRHEVQNAPLHSRAWVLQERFLARRVLHFGQKELFWECGQLNASETWPEGLPDSENHQFKMLNMSNAYKLRQQWLSVRSLYAKTKLTVPDDKMIAISGMAKLFEQLLDDQYFVGLWRSDLLRQLMWTPMKQCRRQPSPPRLYDLPSFSWLSVSGEGIKEHRTGSDITELARVIEANADYLTPEHTGIATNASIKMEGLLREVHVNFPVGSITLPNEIELSNSTLDWETDPAVQQGLRYLFPLFQYGGSFYALLLEADIKAKCFRRIGTTVHNNYPKGLGGPLGVQADQDMFPYSNYDFETQKHAILLR